MASFGMRTAVLVACIALTATPSFAQGGGRGGGGRTESGQRAQPRAGGQSGGRVQPQRQAVPRSRVQVQARAPSERRAAPSPRGRVESQGAQPQRRVAPQRQAQVPRQTQPRIRVEPQGRVSQGGQQTARRVGPPPPVRTPRLVAPSSHVAVPRRVAPSVRVVPRGRVVLPRVGGGYVGIQSYADRRYGNRPYVRRSYVLPYGYRPYGYRPGWSLNLYFGQPYSSYGYSVYSDPRAAYGYYAIVPGRAYGAVRIVDAPRDAQVFVDGYYAGVVDDYDGVFQHLNLEVGPHHIEIEAAGYPLIAFDVNVQPGQTITYRANLR